MLYTQQHNGWAKPPVAVAQLVAAVGRRLHDRPCSPDPFAGIGRRQKGREDGIADARGAPDPLPSDGIQITGKMVRVMMFQSLLIEIGITGWMLRMFCVPPSGP
jgi:hypothetical protein